jgi:hypothetical protein
MENQQSSYLWPRIKRPYLFLLLTLLSFFILNALVGLGLLVRVAIALTTLAMVFAAMSCVFVKRLWLLTAVGSGIGGAALSLAQITRDFFALRVAAEALLLTFITVLSIAILVHVIRSKRATMDTVYGATCVYLMMGLFWAKVFTLLELYYPGSFDLTPPDAQRLVGEFGVFPEKLQLTYYSYITLTTVGFGDVTPLSPPARTLSMLEGLIGQLYLAIMIARMVALQISNKMQDSAP